MHFNYSDDHIADFFIKSLSKLRFQCLRSKLIVYVTLNLQGRVEIEELDDSNIEYNEE
jgi:hypothetical protein